MAEARAGFAAVVAAARLYLTGDSIVRRLEVPESTVSCLVRSAPVSNIKAA